MIWLVGRTVDVGTIVSRIMYCYHSCVDQLLLSYNKQLHVDENALCNNAMFERYGGMSAALVQTELVDFPRHTVMEFTMLGLDDWLFAVPVAISSLLAHYQTVDPHYLLYSHHSLHSAKSE